MIANCGTYSWKYLKSHLVYSKPKLSSLSIDKLAVESYASVKSIDYSIIFVWKTKGIDSTNRSTMKTTQFYWNKNTWNSVPSAIQTKCSINHNNFMANVQCHWFTIQGCYFYPICICICINAFWLPFRTSVWLRRNRRIRRWEKLLSWHCARANRTEMI